MGKFAKDMKAIAKRLRVDVEAIARATLIETFTGIATDTPVLEGRLQGEWQTSVGSRGSADSETGRDGTNEVILEIESTIRGPDVYFFYNNMPYAERIEFDGWSHTKAPRGMARINVAKTETILAKKARELRRK
jgi:hypothetical protein